MALATYSKVFLSGSTSGAPIAIASTSDPGTTIHTAVSGTNAFDELWVWATNYTTTEQLLKFVMGTSSNSGFLIVASVTATNTQLVIPGVPVNQALRISAFSGTTSAVNCYGYVNRIQ